ncbi:MAG: tyrosine/phenylalanine carboxypeptidase domain-containing protein [archaeon]
MRFNDYARLDQKLFETAGAVENNLLKFINPLNFEEEKRLFFAALKKGEEYNPIFTYSERNPSYAYFTTKSALSTFNSELCEMAKETGRDELGIIFDSEILDLQEKIEMIKSIGTANFSGNTESYYGELQYESLRLAIKTIKKNPLEKETPIEFNKAIEIIKNFLKKKRLTYKIVIREPGGARFAVINSRRELLINKDTIFTEEMVKRFIAHEIETHIYRYENGLSQPYKIFAHGFSRETTQTEEGLATCVEKMLGVSSEKQVKEYAGRLVAINTAIKNSFFKTYVEMNKYFDEENSFRLTLRAKRGILDQSKGGAFFKDALYFKGMLHVEKFLKTHEVKELYFGKYAIEDILLVKNIPGLKEPKFMPNLPKS